MAKKPKQEVVDKLIKGADLRRLKREDTKEKEEKRKAERIKKTPSTDLKKSITKAYKNHVIDAGERPPSIKKIL